MKTLLYFIGEDTAFLTHRINLAKAAKKAGFDVHILTRLTNHKKEIEQAGFTVHGLTYFSRGGVNPFLDIACLIELYGLYRKIKPDIVHHVAWKPVLYGSIAAWLTGVPRVINALTGLGYLFISSSLKARVLRNLVRIALPCILNRLNHMMVLQNPDDYDLTEKFFKIPQSRMALIKGSGVDTRTFKPPSSPPKGGRLQFICVSRLLWDKGIHELIEATRITKLTHANFDVILCGDTDPANPAAIPVDRIKAWERQGLIHWRGPVKNVAPLYAHGHVAILPSYREGLPKALLEAASCGLPIITTDVPGCRLIVQNNVNGLLVPAKNSRKLSEAMSCLIDNANLRENFGQEGRKMVMAQFSDKVIIEQFLKLYNNSNS